MSELRVMAWNVQDGLAKPEKAEAIAEKIYGIQPDITILSEGTPEGAPVVPAARRILEELGIVHVRPYNDIDGRRDKHNLVAVAKPEYGQPAISQPLGRTAMVFPEANGFAVAGLHGFDRYRDDQDAEYARERQLAMIIRQALKDAGPAIILGDLNAMYAGAKQAGMLKVAGKVAERFTPGEPGCEQSRFERVVSLTRRLGSMATGDALHMARREGFIDADLDHQPTMPKGPIGVQLDHILVRQGSVRSFNLHPHEGMSDHHAISATIVAL